MAASWLGPPEGAYTLVSSVNVPIPNTTNFLGSSAPVGQQAVPPVPVEAAPLPPPATKPAFAVVSVRFPVKEGGGLAGLGMSMGSLRGGPSRGRGETNAPAGAEVVTSPALSPAGLPTAGDSTSGSSNGDTDAHMPLPISGAPPPLRRKQLSSSFSIPSLSTLGLGAGDQPVTSRPSRQFRGTSSSFVRSWEGIPLSQPQLRAIAETNAGKDTLFVFYTSGKDVVWSELGPGKGKDPLAKLAFSTPPTCININQHTANSQQIDVLVGFGTGDIFWFDPLCAKYTRLNKSGCITSSPIISIQWLPPAASYSPTENHANLFLTSHIDGTVLVWDKDREDWGGFTPSVVPASWIGGPSPKETPGMTKVDARSVQGEPRPMADIIVSRPPPMDKKGTGPTTNNPVSHWRVSRKPINALAFSPDLQHCATVGDDGCLRIIEVGTEKLLDAYAGYFGALNSVAWSPDGRFIVTGGQDDLCTIYSPREQRLVARCQGHSSWVTGVSWDPRVSDERSARFASVGEDYKFILWELSSAALTRPKAHVHQPPRHNRPDESAAHLPLSTTERPTPIYHPPRARAEVAMLQPFMVKVASTDLLVALIFLPDYLITLSRAGQIKQWGRPPKEQDP